MSDSSGHDVDAIRYAVLRKLAAGMRHALMGDLQTIQFSAELAAKMLESGAASTKLEECIRLLPDQTRAAVASCRAMVEWLRPEDKATTVAEAVQRCMIVAGDDWSLRGIQSSSDVRTGNAHVSKPVVQELLVTAVLALTDTYPGPADIHVLAEATGDDVLITLSAKQVERKSPFPPLTSYRALTFADVIAVAAANRAACACNDRTITLRLRTLSTAG
ncbi:MAG TPA: hypothetical protein VGK37_12545 [Casimicrobiaceae bacterium]|jgi:hypothetical protein